MKVLSRQRKPGTGMRRAEQEPEKSRIYGGNEEPPARHSGQLGPSAVPHVRNPMYAVTIPPQQDLCLPGPDHLLPQVPSRSMHRLPQTCTHWDTQGTGIGTCAWTYRDTETHPGCQTPLGSSEPLTLCLPPPPPLRCSPFNLTAELPPSITLSCLTLTSRPAPAALPS